MIGQRMRRVRRSLLLDPYTLGRRRRLVPLYGRHWLSSSSSRQFEGASFRPFLVAAAAASVCLVAAASARVVAEGGNPPLQLSQQQQSYNDDGYKYKTLCEEGGTTVIPQEVQKLRLCGKWCRAAAANADYNTPCRVDTRRVPCRGVYCQTTAGLWTQFVLAPGPQRKISCDLYKASLAYPDAAKPCDACCHIPEINPSRYPQPTGLGVFCKPGTCRPAASPRHAPHSGLGILQCPCNWFGSECKDTAMPIRSVHKTTLGDGGLVHLRLDVEDPRNVLLKEHRPGCVVRLQQFVPQKNGTSDDHDDDSTGDGIETIFESAFAVARQDLGKTTTRSLEVLVAPPSPHLHDQMVHLNNVLRSLTDGTHVRATSLTNNKCDDETVAFLQQVYVNPVVSGFYNMEYQYFLDYLYKQQEEEAAKSHITTVVLVATGAGLAGVMSAIQALLAAQEEGKLPRTQMHLYYGLRNADDNLAYRSQLEQWVEQGHLLLTLVDSSRPPPPLNNRSPDNDKYYVQHAVSEDLKNGVLDTDGSAVFVVCGHLPVMDAIRNLLPSHLRESRLFLNI